MKIAICVPSGDMIHADFARCLVGLLLHSARSHELFYINGKSSIVATARNNCVKQALAFDVDYILFLDADMVFPPNILDRLLESGKDIIGCAYRRRSPPYDIMALSVQGPGSQKVEGIAEMLALPTGVLLIAAKVFESIPKPWFKFEIDAEREKITGEDVLFCREAVLAGYKIWMDVEASYHIGHLTQSTLVISKEDSDE